MTNLGKIDVLNAEFDAELAGPPGGGSGPVGLVRGQEEPSADAERLDQVCVTRVSLAAGVAGVVVVGAILLAATIVCALRLCSSRPTKLP